MYATRWRPSLARSRRLAGAQAALTCSGTQSPASHSTSGSPGTSHSGSPSTTAFARVRRRAASASSFERHFAEYDELGYTILALSSLSQPSTARQRRVLKLKDRELIELNEALSVEVVDETRAVEGKLIADAKLRFGEIPPWNTAVGRLPSKPADREDATLGIAVGAADLLLQARKTIRELASNGEWAMFEERLHGARISAVRRIVLSGGGSPDELIRDELDNGLLGMPDPIADAIKQAKYLEQRCPVTVGPSLLEERGEDV